METDLILYTDGSGHEDGFGGYAALVKTPDGKQERFVMAACSATNTDRMEFTALVEGLRLAMDLWKTFSTSWEWQDMYTRKLTFPRVHWYSDRESLVLSVKRVYGRDNCPDLWAAFQYFEDNMIITSQHVTDTVKESMPEFMECDLQSSSARVVIKNYYAQTPLHVDLALMKPRLKKEKKCSQQPNVSAAP